MRLAGSRLLATIPLLLIVSVISVISLSRSKALKEVDR